VKEHLAQRGIKVIYTPSYTPDANPIENIFSIFKHHFRSIFVDCHCLETSLEVSVSCLQVAPSTIYERCFDRSFRLCVQPYA
jgi:hypothetical protein